MTTQLMSYCLQKIIIKYLIFQYCFITRQIISTEFHSESEKAQPPTNDIILLVTLIFFFLNALVFNFSIEMFITRVMNMFSFSFSIGLL